jgi:hypothetical protein
MAARCAPPLVNPLEARMTLFSSGKGPQAPDPYATASAQTKSNQDTANYNASLNRVSTYTPYGNQVYSQSGVDASGAPRYSDTISLTPASQQQLETQQLQDSHIASLGLGLTNQIGNSLSEGLPDTAKNGQAAQDAYYGQQKSFLDPQYSQMQSDLDAKLANQGIVQGSDAANRANENLGRQRTQAYGNAADQAITQGQTTQQQALANAIMAQNQPINQLASLRSGTTIQNPNFPTAPTANAAGTDVSGIINNGYQQQSANYNNKMAGITQAASTAAMASDRRLKRNIKRIGTTPVMKLPVYSFRYIWDADDHPLHTGVMAQEVLKVIPKAVTTMANGFMAVYYGLLA